MTTATAQIAPGYTLTGTTPGSASAPITYSVNGITVGNNILSYIATKNSNGTFTFKVNGIVIDSSVSPAINTTVVGGIDNAKAAVDNSIDSQNTTVSNNFATPTISSNIDINTISKSPAIVPSSVANAPDLNTVGTLSAPSVPTTATVDPVITGDIKVNPDTITVDSVANAGDINTISKPLTVTQEDLNQAAANGTDNLGVIASAPGADVASQVIKIAPEQDSTKFNARADWRVRLALTDDSSANYLYKSQNPGILAPLKETNGVIFPYTPNITVNYVATYEPTSLVHSNYKVNQYSGSSVESVQLTCDFTAQDTYEANYLLAVIHFFRTMTKMFYGQDSNPKAGTPPPLCYLFGMGTYQFSAHPLAITGFNYNLPTNVDYIKTVASSNPGIQQPNINTSADGRPYPRGVGAGGTPAAPAFQNVSPTASGEVTWVPTQIQLSISCLPIQSRNQVSNKFSLRDYANGTLLNGIKNPGGAFW